MRQKPFLACVVVSLLLLAVRALGAEVQAPMAVSPGSTDHVAVVESRCPTFSWGQVTGARSYELVVYRLGEEDEAAGPVLSQRISGSALSWTPSLDRCLERSRQYAWSIRAESGKAPGEWSEARLFRIVSGPSLAEVRAALAVLEEFERGVTALDRDAMPSAPRHDLAPPPAPPVVRNTEDLPESELPSVYSFDSTGMRMEDTTSASTSAVGLHSIVPTGDDMVKKWAVFGEVFGSASDSALSFGVYGATGSQSGVAVRGDAYSESGSVTGVMGVTNSSDGYGGQFFNHGGGVAVRVFGTLLLQPTDNMVTCDTNNLGAVYFDSSENWLCICDGVSFKRADTTAACS
jgi:hypothetical protein